MEKVTGIGGFFFKAQKPDELAAWYQQHFGIDLTPQSYDGKAWEQEAGTTVFQPFPADTDYFGKADKQWMLNLRVSNLDAMLAQLEAAGIDVEIDATNYPNGRFAHLFDPEGNRVELWEPA
jgi:predicted enzyme related to lactoylglutathione lyase